MRAAPPAVVSPLMLALTTRQPGWLARMRCAVSATQPWLAGQAVAGRQRIAHHQHVGRGPEPQPAEGRGQQRAAISRAP